MTRSSSRCSCHRFRQYGWCPCCISDRPRGIGSAVLYCDTCRRQRTCRACPQVPSPKGLRIAPAKTAPSRSDRARGTDSASDLENSSQGWVMVGALRVDWSAVSCWSNCRSAFSFQGQPPSHGTCMFKPAPCRKNLLGSRTPHHSHRRRTTPRTISYTRWCRPREAGWRRFGTDVSSAAVVGIVTHEGAGPAVDASPRQS
jgi:hypothetical protein